MKERRFYYFFLLISIYYLVDAQKKEDNFIYDGNPIDILTTVHVGLIGFENAISKGFDQNRLKLMLETSLKKHQPHVMESGNALPINFKIKYDISSNIDSIEYERLLANSISSSNYIDSFNKNYLVKVDSKMEEYFETLTNKIFEYKNNNNKSGEYSIFFIMINKERMASMISGIVKNFNYLLLYNSQEGNKEQKIGGQSWISSKRYIVVDYSSGTSIIGYNGNTNELLINSNSFIQSELEIPSLESVHLSQVLDIISGVDSNGVFFNEIEIEATITKTIITSIRYVFFPDLRFHSTSHADKVLIPIIVLRNHNYFNPLVYPNGDQSSKYGDEYRIDISLIKKEISKLFKNKEDVAIISGIHSLHEHRHFSLAIAKATRSKSIHIYSPSSGTQGEGGKYIEITKEYFDSSSLLSSVFSSHDFLASSFLSSSSGISISDKFAKIFFNPGIPDLEADLDPSKSKSTTGKNNDDISSTLQSNFIDRSQNKERINKYGRSGRSKGTKILPVFVLSMMPDDLLKEETILFERETLLAIGKELVIVLQVNNSVIPVPYKFSHFSDSYSQTKQRITTDTIYLDGRSVTQHIIAGIASSLGSLVPPFIRYSPSSNSFNHDYTFALGNHPFGYFSNSSHLSQINVDIALRNVIFTRIAFAYDVINSSIQDIDLFAMEYLYDPFSDNIFHAKEGWTKYIERLYHEQVNLPDGVLSPIAITTVYQLHKELERLSNQLSEIARLIESYRLEEAYSLSATLEMTVLAFEDYVDSQIEESISKLLCCSLITDVKIPSSSISLQTWILTMLIFGCALVWVIWIVYIVPSKKKTKS